MIDEGQLVSVDIASASAFRPPPTKTSSALDPYEKKPMSKNTHNEDKRQWYAANKEKINAARRKRYAAKESDLLVLQFVALKEHLGKVPQP